MGGCRDVALGIVIDAASDADRALVADPGHEPRGVKAEPDVGGERAQIDRLVRLRVVAPQIPHPAAARLRRAPGHVAYVLVDAGGVEQRDDVVSPATFSGIAGGDGALRPRVDGDVIDVQRAGDHGVGKEDDDLVALAVQAVAAVHGILDGRGDHRLWGVHRPLIGGRVVALGRAVRAIAADAPQAAVGVCGPDDDVVHGRHRAGRLALPTGVGTHRLYQDRTILVAVARGRQRGRDHLAGREAQVGFQGRRPGDHLAGAEGQLIGTGERAVA